MATDLVGKTINEYHLQSIAGEGAQATVYRAYQPSLSRQVAIKILFADYEKDGLIRFEREAKVIAQLRHKNIIVVYDYGQFDDHPYIVMEYVERGTLRDHMSQEPMEWYNVIHLALPLAGALEYAHRQNLVHRDIKPSNILMPAEDWPLLADFTLVKIEGSSITGHDTIIGTPAYMSPEQVNSLSVDARADIYSFGILLFEMITGRLPFDYPRPHLVMMAHINEEMPSPADINPACPPALANIILKATQKSPDDRYATIEEMSRDLNGVVGSSTLPMPGDTPWSKPSVATKPFPAADEEPPPTSPISEPEPPTESTSTPQLLIIDKDVTLDLSGVEGTPLIIGRAYSNATIDIDLGPHNAFDAGVSRRHASLFKQGDTWFIDDLESSNGTFVNDTVVLSGKPVALNNGDIIRCGKLSLVFFNPSD